MVPSSDMQKNKKIVRETISRVTGCRQALPPPANSKQATNYPLKTCGLLAVSYLPKK